jgi:carboxymethylenebutenolidase
MLRFMNTLPPMAFMDPTIRDQALATLPETARLQIEETRTKIMGGPGKSGLMTRDWVPQLLATTRYLRQVCPVTRGQKVASVGFCMGGGLSALLACHDPNLAACVVFYGVAPPTELIPNIRCPVLAFYGSVDQRINAGIPAFTQAMEQHHKSYEKHIFDEAMHAFFNDTRPAYDVRAARDAFARTLDLFRRTLA